MTRPSKRRQAAVTGALVTALTAAPPVAVPVGGDPSPPPPAEEWAQDGTGQHMVQNRVNSALGGSFRDHDVTQGGFRDPAGEEVACWGAIEAEFIEAVYDADGENVGTGGNAYINLCDERANQLVSEDLALFLNQDYEEIFDGLGLNRELDAARAAALDARDPEDAEDLDLDDIWNHLDRDVRSEVTDALREAAVDAGVISTEYLYYHPRSAHDRAYSADYMEPLQVPLLHEAWQRLRPRLVPPDVSPSPRRGQPAVVRVATFVAVDNQRVQAEPEGGGPVPVRVRITAVPTLIFDPGDGSDAMECPGGGTVFDPDGGSPEEQARGDECAHIYEDPSPGGGYPGEVSYEWDITWTSSGPAGDSLGGEFDPITETRDLPRVVDEVDTVVSDAGWDGAPE